MKRLTNNGARSKVVLISNQSFQKNEPTGTFKSDDFDYSDAKSRKLSMLLSELRGAGVFFGLRSESHSEFRKPTRQEQVGFLFMEAIRGFSSDTKVPGTIRHRWRSG